jgi:pilus assembly protein Flp/PilA
VPAVQNTDVEQKMLNALTFDILAWLGADEEGAAAIEYGLIASLVSVAVVAALTLAGDSLEQLLGLITQALQPT